MIVPLRGEEKPLKTADRKIGIWRAVRACHCEPVTDVTGVAISIEFQDQERHTP